MANMCKWKMAHTLNNKKITQWLIMGGNACGVHIDQMKHEQKKNVKTIAQHQCVYND